MSTSLKEMDKKIAARSYRSNDIPATIITITTQQLNSIINYFFVQVPFSNIY